MACEALRVLEGRDVPCRPCRPCHPRPQPRTPLVGMVVGVVVVMVVVPLLPPTAALWLGGCDGALGMESGGIPDTAITASSSHDHIVGPHNARVRVEKEGGAWCPRTQVAANSREYLEVDLAGVHVVTASGTQGRFDNGKGLEYTQSYMLEYWRPGLASFRVYTSSHGNQTFPGNINTYLEQRNALVPPLVASKVRFIPVSSHPRTVCLRVELYGCPNTGVVSYSVVDGKEKDPGLLLTDNTYDGSRGPGPLQRGLGQLYDGQLGTPLTNLQLQTYSRGKGEEGWEWVGWSLAQVQREPLHLTFVFATMRNFSSLALHVFSSPRDDFQVPSKAEVYFGEDGTNFHEKAVASPPTWPGALGPGVHNLSLALRHRPARVLRLLLYFPGPWLALSEVYFDSEPCQCNLTDWADGKTTSPAEHIAGRHDDPTRDVSTVSAAHAHTRAFMGVVVGFVVVVFLLVAAGLLIYVRRLRKKKASPHVLKSPPSETASTTFDLKSLRLPPSFSGASTSTNAGASLYGPVAVPGEEGSLYHEPYKTPMFSASQYSVATIGRHLSDHSRDGTATPARRSASGLVGGEYALPILKTPPPALESAASHYTTTLPYSHSTPHSTYASFSPAPAPPSTLPPASLPSLSRFTAAPLRLPSACPPPSRRCRGRGVGRRV
ncbi:discoidin domain-containing receptor tyrosine kinase B-like isoform X2 [Scylla paramamosain]|uniref:discoidin domain-containing receptor tyrosine kinase B-like isoform X2 n=1 Tax=Scylla paramamosain TaxID=85552 RepID=UPI0030839A13